MVSLHFDGDIPKADLWFNTPNPQLGNVTPWDMVSSGKRPQLLKFIKEQLSENDRERT